MIEGSGKPFHIVFVLLPMKRHHPIESAAVLTVAAVRLARVALVPVIAFVLTVAGWQPGTTTQPQPASMPAASLPVNSLTVAQLRVMARSAGYRTLARSGRRAELLAALALA
jgi:hypothetical protein